MNEVYAVDPAAPTDSQELRLLLKEFGFDTGRFIAEFPLGWIDEVRAAFALATEMERKRVIEILEKRRRGLTTRARAKFLPSVPWVENAVRAKAEFERVIGCRQNKVGLVTVEEVLNNDEKALRPGREDYLPAKATEYARVAQPLFEASAEVILVDRFFLRAGEYRGAERKRRVLAELLRCAESSGTCERFLLMLELPPPGTMSRSAAEAEVDGHIRWACHHAEVKRLKVRRALRAVVDHPRFLFSVLGGLKFDHGFDELSGKRNLVSWLSQPVLADLLDQFTGRGNHAEA